MAKKNKKRRSPNERNVPPLPASKPSKKVDKKPAPTSHQGFREGVESLVIALVLAFLFRTFQAEAFVIPTGSMAQTLMGRHKDVYCDQCGQRFKVNASDEGRTALELANHPVFSNFNDPRRRYYEAQTVAGRCQNCRYPMPFVPDLPASVPEATSNVAYENSSSGDRILVNKYLYSFTEPKRWDVVVFKYPGDAVQNYIKRLVGLPGETLRIYQGDLYSNGGEGEAFEILRKPADKVLAMRQLVHDTDHDPVSLHEAGWPLRWQAADDASQWEVATEKTGKTIKQTYRLGSTDGDQPHWLRYTHAPPTPSAWRVVREKIADQQPLDNALTNHRDADAAKLVTDFNSYNTEVQRWRFAEARNNGLIADTERAPDAESIHWASDLSVDAKIRVKSQSGALLLELVEAGQHFTCEIDTATGEATLKVLQHETLEEVLSLGAAKTSLRGPGTYQLRFANVDDQLLLWVNGTLVSFDGKNAYDAATAFGQPDRLTPKTSDADAGDLAPVGIGARGADIEISRLQVYRDIYYIADRWTGVRKPVTDYALIPGTTNGVRTPAGIEGPVWEVANKPALWPAIADRRSEDFEIKLGQLFVMGDNSSSSKDCRLWTSNDALGRPGGLYLERSLLTGKAVCVYWPHALVSLPTPKRGVRIPIVPNLGDIRLVR